MLTLEQGAFNESLLDTCWLTIAATDDDEVNQRVSDACEARRIFCNVVDAPKEASFIMPSIIDRSPLMIAVSSGDVRRFSRVCCGKTGSPVAPASWPDCALCRAAALTREANLRDRGRAPSLLGKFFVNDRLAQSLANQDTKAVEETTEQLLSEPLDHRGEVVLVGAGPGDAGLLTLKGLQQIQQADIVVYDRLVSDDIMNLVRRDADRVFVGKRAGYHCVPQEEINQILLREAQRENAWCA